MRKRIISNGGPFAFHQIELWDLRTIGSLDWFFTLIDGIALGLYRAERNPMARNDKP